MADDDHIFVVPADPTEPLPWSRRAIVFRLLLIATVLLALDGIFWFTADFRTFVPPSDGPFEERLILASATASGPFVMGIINRWDFWGCMNALLLASIVAALVASAIAWPKRDGARLVAYLAVVVWFFFGFSGTCLRIT